MSKCYTAGTVQWGENGNWPIVTTNKLVFMVDATKHKFLSGITRDFRPGQVVWIIYECGDQNILYDIKAIANYNDTSEEMVQQMLEAV